MIRYLPALGWTTAMYLVTAITAGWAVSAPIPLNATAIQASQSAFWFELTHVILHSASYALLISLLVVSHHPLRWRDARIAVLTLLGIALAVGVGQETLQSAVRMDVNLANSLLDIASNLSGAALALVVMLRKTLGLAAGRQHGV